MCAVVGVLGNAPVVGVTLSLMRALQHRGRQTSGIACIKADKEIIFETEVGHVENLDHLIRSRNLHKESVRAGIGHIRYGTAGDRGALLNAQPFYVAKNGWSLYIAHNGDTPFYDGTREQFTEQGAGFNTSSDTEFILKYICAERDENPLECIRQGLAKYRGTYALTMLLVTKDDTMLIAARDHTGNRPLAFGFMEDGTWLVASEDSAFETVGATPVRDIKPGELLVMRERGTSSSEIPRTLDIRKLHQCFFELIYFAYPSSHIFGGVPVASIREELGKILGARLRSSTEHHDIVVPVPDSGKFFAHGFAHAVGKREEEAILRRHHFGRSFLMDTDEGRKDVLRGKLSFIEQKVRGSRVWLCDDSVVRGHTSRKLVRALKNLGASWVGVVSSAPPIVGACKKGVDFAEDLVAAAHRSHEGIRIDEICAELEADALYYTTINDLHEAMCNVMGDFNYEYCFGCFEGREPIWKVW